MPVAPHVDGRTARRADTRQVVFAAALSLFAQQGVTTTSVDEIAERAGVAKGSIYYNFGSKAGLVDALMAHHIDELTNELRAATSGMTGWEGCREAVAHLLRQVETRPEFARVAAAETFRMERSWGETTRALRDESIGVFADLLEQGQRDGSVSPTVDPRLAAAALFGGTLVAGLEWLIFSPHRSAEEVLEALVETLGHR